MPPLHYNPGSHASLPTQYTLPAPVAPAPCPSFSPGPLIRFCASQLHPLGTHFLTSAVAVCEYSSPGRPHASPSLSHLCSIPVRTQSEHRAKARGQCISCKSSMPPLPTLLTLQTHVFVVVLETWPFCPQPEQRAGGQGIRCSRTPPLTLSPMSPSPNTPHPACPQ